jgi:uncharacterized protein
MSLLINLRDVEPHDLHLKGQLTVEDLDIDTCDEVIRLEAPLAYDLAVQKLDEALLVQGRLELTLHCECVRCLKPFQYRLKLSPWTCHLPLQGEDAVPVNNDCVDLTPFVRDDILLGFPQHPLCDPECRGLPGTSPGQARNTSSAGPSEAGSPVWAELNKLKL